MERVIEKIQCDSTSNVFGTAPDTQCVVPDSLAGEVPLHP